MSKGFSISKITCLLIICLLTLSVISLSTTAALAADGTRVYVKNGDTYFQIDDDRNDDGDGDGDGEDGNGENPMENLSLPGEVNTFIYICIIIIFLIIFCLLAIVFILGGIFSRLGKLIKTVDKQKELLAPQYPPAPAPAAAPVPAPRPRQPPRAPGQGRGRDRSRRPGTINCPECGYENPSDERYCVDCDAPLR